MSLALELMIAENGAVAWPSCSRSIPSSPARAIRRRFWPIDTLIRKLDAHFFAGRWSRVPDRQRELLLCIAHLTNAAEEFTVNQIAEVSRHVAKRCRIKPFKTGDVSSMIPKLINAGLVYKNRHGKYLLAVPLFDRFIRRQFDEPSEPHEK